MTSHPETVSRSIMRQLAKPLLVLLLTAILLQILPQTAWGQVSFQSPQPLTLMNGTDTLPSAIRLSNNQLWIVWENVALTGQTTIYLDTYNGVWSGTQAFISGPGRTANISPSLAQLQNGTIILAWSSNSTGHYNIYYKLYNNGVWSSSSRLTTITSDDYLSKMTVSSDNTVWVFWERDSSSTSCINNICRQIFYKTLRANQWSSDTAFTTNSYWSSFPYPTATPDGRVWLAWSSTSSASNGFNILYSVYNGQWSTSVQLTTTTTTDTHPALVADRNSTLWLFFTRDVVLSSGPNGISENDLFYKYSYNLGSTWTAPVQLSIGGSSTNPIDSQEPTLVQGSDKMLYIFYVTGSGTAYDIYYIRSYPIATHDVAPTQIQYPAFQYPGGLASTGESPIMKINITISNLGDYSETVTVTGTVSNATSYNLASVTGSVPAGSSTVFTLRWNTTGVKPARYTVSTSVTTVNNDEPALNTYNNNMIARDLVRVIPLGDYDQDGSMTITDISVFFYDYGFSSTCNCSRYNPYVDLNNNGLIDIVDIGIALANYNTYI